MDKISPYLNILSYVAFGVVGIYAIRSKVKDNNNKDLITRVAILEREREENRLLAEREREEFRKLLEDEKEASRKLHMDNQKAIANLEGQLATYKEIPLKSIADSLVQLTESNSAILDTLQGSAKISEKQQSNGGLLVKSNITNPLDVKEVK